MPNFDRYMDDYDKDLQADPYDYDWDEREDVAEDDQRYTAHLIEVSRLQERTYRL